MRVRLGSLGMSEQMQRSEGRTQRGQREDTMGPEMGDGSRRCLTGAHLASARREEKPNG